MVSDWLNHPVKCVQVFKDSSVKAVYTVFVATSINCTLSQCWQDCPLHSVALLFAPLPSFDVYYLVPGSLVIFSFAGYSFCTSQQSGNLGSFFFFFFISVDGQCKQVGLCIKQKVTPLVDLLDEKTSRIR